MALTIAITNGPFIIGDRRGVIAKVSFDSSYATNGESLKPEDLGMTVIDFLICEPTNGYLYEYDYTNKKLKAKYPTKTQAVANSSSNQLILTTGSNSATAVDATRPHVDVPAGFRSAVDAGAAEEVGSAVSLAADTNVRLFAIGA